MRKYLKYLKFIKIIIILIFNFALIFLFCSCGFSGAYEKRLEAGEEALKAFDYNAAMAAYREAAALRRNRPEGYWGMGDVALELAAIAEPWSAEQDINLQNALENYQKASAFHINQAKGRDKLIAYYLFLAAQAVNTENAWKDRTDALPQVIYTDAGIYITGINNLNNLNNNQENNDAEMNINPDLDLNNINISLDIVNAGLLVMDSEKGISITDGQRNLIALHEMAESCYISALEIDIASVETRLQFASFLESRERLEEAIKILEDGLPYSNDAALSERAEEIKLNIRRLEEEARRVSATRILAAAPYYGDYHQCHMTSETALAYAKLISDGLTGKFKGFSGYGQPLYDYPVYWDEAYPVIGYGSYETNRALAFLGDFGADGQPCLIIISGLVSYGSFEIYGKTDENQVALLTGEESYGSSRPGRLIEREDGTVILEKVLVNRDDFQSGETWRFNNGAGEASQVWEEVWDAESGMISVTRNGTMMGYTREQWEARRNSEESASNQRGWAALSHIISKACPLRDMMRYLNAYAAELRENNNNINPAIEYQDNNNNNLEIPIPPDHSQRHKMAVAMLRKLYELEHLSIDTDTRLCALKLGDLNQDGAEELCAAFTGEYEADNGTLCQFIIYEWRGGGLSEIPGGNHLSELRLVKDKNTGETGILGTGYFNNLNNNQDNNLNNNLNNQERYFYAFLSRTLELRRDKNAGRYEIIRDGGQSAGITQSEYAALKNLYEESDLFVNYNRPVELNHNSYARIVAALYQIRDAA